VPTCAIVSFRLGLTDGVSVIAARWSQLVAELGFEVTTVAGSGNVDRLVPGLELGATTGPTHGDVESALGDADVVIVENLLTIPMNLPASRVVTEVLAGRPALLHHHDPPWQREHYRHITELPPDDPAWRHVTINDLTRRELAERGVDATTIYNVFHTEAAPGDRAAMRRRLGVHDDTLLLAHPVRAIARKNIPVALQLAAELGGTYWLLGQAEDGYGQTLDRLLATADIPVIQRGAPTIPDIYAAADLVVFPSTWEGFGNPPIEAAIHRRGAIVGPYPVADELRALGFRWFGIDDLDAVRGFLADGDDDTLSTNQRLAHQYFSFAAVREQLRDLFATAGWLPYALGQ
jgi:mannosylglucosylglycerate synthase